MLQRGRTAPPPPTMLHPRLLAAACSLVLAWGCAQGHTLPSGQGGAGGSGGAGGAFTCPVGTTHCGGTDCVPATMACDGTCEIGFFACTGGGCVPESFQCDGVPDCADGSDEKPKNPACGTGACTAGLFTCQDGTCVPSGFQCDGEKDCADGSDELPLNTACM